MKQRIIFKSTQRSTIAFDGMPFEIAGANGTHYLVDFRDTSCRNVECKANEVFEVKPVIQIIGFPSGLKSDIRRAWRALYAAGEITKADEMEKRSFDAGGYDAAIEVIKEYVTIK